MSIIVLSTCVPKINVGRTMNLAMNMIQLSKIPVLVMRNHTITFNWRNYPVTSPMNRHGFTGTPLIWMSFGLMIFSLLKSLSCLNGFYCFAFCVLVLQKNTQKMPKKTLHIRQYSYFDVMNICIFTNPQKARTIRVCFTMILVSRMFAGCDFLRTKRCICFKVFFRRITEVAVHKATPKKCPMPCES